MRRDTLAVKPQGHIVLRFRSDNPGVWLFHCHIEWHVDSGLVMTFVEVCFVLSLSVVYPLLPSPATMSLPSGIMDTFHRFIPPPLLPLPQHLTTHHPFYL